MTMRHAGPVADARVWLRTALAATIIVLVPAMVSRAEAQTSLPEITVSPPQPPPRIQDQLEHKDGGDGKSGAGGKGEGNQTLDRLNQQLKRKVDETNPIGNNPPLDARSPDTKTGVINIPGVQQQYGKNFGHSAIPYRPAPPVYSAPLGHR